MAHPRRQLVELSHVVLFVDFVLFLEIRLPQLLCATRRLGDVCGRGRKLVDKRYPVGVVSAAVPARVLDHVTVLLAQRPDRSGRGQAVGDCVECGSSKLAKRRTLAVWICKFGDLVCRYIVVHRGPLALRRGLLLGRLLRTAASCQEGF